MDLISDQSFEHEFGIVRHRVMSNEEVRVTIVNSDSSSYAYTTSPVGGWQNAHYHKGLIETYIVQAGWIAFASEAKKSSDRIVAIYTAGQQVTSEPYVSHNVFMSPGSVIHTVKHGTAVPNENKPDRADWYDATEDFSKWTSSFTEVELKKINVR